MLTGFRAGLLAAVLCVPGAALARTFDPGLVETRAARDPSLAIAHAHPLEPESLFGLALGSDIGHGGAIGDADDVAGKAGFGFAFENTLILDAEPRDDRLWGAGHLVWEF